MKDERIVCLSWVTYDFVPLLMHHMMRKLARENTVLFVDPPIALATFLLHPSLIPNLRKQWKNWRQGVKRVEENLYLYTPPPLLFQYGIFETNDMLNRWRVERALVAAMREVGFEDPILWVYAPFMVGPGPALPRKMLIYDCHDEVSAFVNPRRRKEGLARLERDFIKNADLVFTTTKSLYETKSPLHQRISILPPGVDVEMFERALDPALGVPPELETISRPRIGFTGNIDNFRMDWDLVLEISKRHPDWQQVLIGPNYDPIPSRVKGIPNVHFLGKRRLEELPGYIKGFDVCYMPYLQGEWSRHAFPTKTFEYLAAGKKTVTVTIPALEDLGSVISMVEGKNAFIEALERALDEGEERIQERVKMARRNTWDARVRKTVEVIETYAREMGIPIRGASR